MRAIKNRMPSQEYDGPDLRGLDVKPEMATICITSVSDDGKIEKNQNSFIFENLNKNLIKIFVDKTNELIKYPKQSIKIDIYSAPSTDLNHTSLPPLGFIQIDEYLQSILSLAGLEAKFLMNSEYLQEQIKMFNNNPNLLKKSV